MRQCFKVSNLFIILLLSVLFVGCNNKINPNEPIFQHGNEWKENTINKVLSGYNKEEDLFIDYSESDISFTIDEIWRMVKVYEITGFSYDKPQIISILDTIITNSTRERLEVDFICRKKLSNECEQNYKEDYDLLVENIYKQDTSKDEELYETLDILYFLATEFMDELNESSKMKISRWLQENNDQIQNDLGFLYSKLEIENNLGIKNIDVKNKEYYEELLVKTLNKENTDLIDLYYIFYINYYLNNSLDEQTLFNKIMEFYNKEYGFSLSKDEYIDGNLGTFLGVKMISDLGKLDLIRFELLSLIEEFENEYGGIINKENIPSGTVEETIMGHFILEKFNESKPNNNKLIDVSLNSNDISWFWTFYSLELYGSEIDTEYKEKLIEKIEVVENEVINKTFTNKDYEQLLESSGVLREIEYVSRVGMLLDYPFKADYQDRIELLSNEIIEKASEDEIDVLSSILVLSNIFDFKIDNQKSNLLVKDLLEENNYTNFYQWYSIIKAASNLKLIDKNDVHVLLSKYMKSTGGVYGDIEVESSDTLFSTFLMLSLIEEIKPNL